MMMRVPSVVFSGVAVVGLVVAILGLALDWARVAPVAFFVFVFCTILATMQRSLATMEPSSVPAAESSGVAASADDGEQTGLAVEPSPRMDVADAVETAPAEDERPRS